MKQKRKGALSVFLSYFKPHYKLFAVDMLCAVTVSVVDLAFPLATRQAMYTLLPEQKYMAFFVLMAIMVAAYALRAVLHYIIAYWGHTFGIRVEADIRRDLFLHMQTLDLSFYDRNRTGQLMSRLTSDLFEITELAHHGPENLLISTLTLVGAMIVMFSVEWRLALVVFLLIPIFLSLIIVRRRAMGEASRAEKRKAAEINAGIESSLSGIRTARAFANEPGEIEKFDTANEAYKKSKGRFHKEMGRFNAVMEMFTSILNVAVISVGGFLIMRGEMNYIDLITFSLYITAFVNPVRKLAQFSETFAKGMAGLDRFRTLMEMEPRLKDAPDAVELGKVRGEIAVRDVSFSYEGEDAPEVLHHVDISIAAGEVIAVVGPSGGGKSTLCQLLPRFYEVNEGAITVDGMDIRSVTQRSLRRNIGIVQQDVFLFADTVRENIRYGYPDATEEQIVEAAKRAEIYDDIMEMPDGFDTYVGERGVLLSGGQKQRMSIARIFLKNPPVLILDEATSALDSVTEMKIQRALDELSKGRTTILIAHRLSTIRNADRILVIEDGYIVEQGSHAALMEKNGVYAALYRTQNGERDG
ncbi:MAG: ABC transporter ATP-binding protein [Oscillospiraceae bacterium]|nr:ABC transporter ATP-binding protein [Oscillospiraceae bacterium]